jgi:hypothetical protein
MEVRQKRLMTMEAKRALLSKLHAEAIDAMHNAPDRPVTLYMSAGLAAQRAAQSDRSRAAPAGATNAILTTASSGDAESPLFGFNPDRMQSAGGSSTMLAYHATLGK